MDVQYSLPNLMTTAPATGGALGDAAAWDPLLLPLVLPVRVERPPIHEVPTPAATREMVKATFRMELVD